MLLAWKFRLAAVAVAAPLAIGGFALGHGWASSKPLVQAPELVEVPAGSFHYRLNGGFTRDGRQIGAPVTTVIIKQPLHFMRRQVTAAEYQRCVNAGACKPAGAEGMAPDRPMVKVSWYDAHAYAAWLSRETGKHFRLPTDQEWAYAAASRFTDDGAAGQVQDPGNRDLVSYESESSRSQGIAKEPLPVGSFGTNEHGLADLAGNVWEWTDTCFVRTALDDQGETVGRTPYCGVRIAEGRHRAYVIDFIRDPRGGGCSVGTPPTNLGFRLVLDQPEESAGLHLVLDGARRLFGLRG